MLKAAARRRPRNTADRIPGALSRTDRVRHSGYAVIVTSLDKPAGGFAPPAPRSALGERICSRLSAAIGQWQRSPLSP